jgi:hypothetical protein
MHSTKHNIQQTNLHIQVKICFRFEVEYSMCGHDSQPEYQLCGTPNNCQGLDHGMRGGDFFFCDQCFLLPDPKSSPTYSEAAAANLNSEVHEHQGGAEADRIATQQLWSNGAESLTIKETSGDLLEFVDAKLSYNAEATVRRIRCLLECDLWDRIRLDNQTRPTTVEKILFIQVRKWIRFNRSLGVDLFGADAAQNRVEFLESLVTPR